MTTRSRTTLKAWFRTAMKPTQEQFSDAWDSFWHKDEKMPVNQVSNLQEILNNKSEYNHFHEIGEVSNLAEELAGKTDESRTDSLQEQIYALSRITAIRGSVDTYEELEALDTKGLRDGDSYIVERDETREHTTTLYTVAILEDAYQWSFTGDWQANAGATRLEDLEDTRIGVLQNGQVLQWNGTKWVNTAISLSVELSENSVALIQPGGNRSVIAASTTTAAGAMTVTDRKKMDALFNGSIVDSTFPLGWHKHNYLELSDLPPIVQFSAASYAEFKTAYTKALTIVAQGKFVEIVQTGNWVISDSTIFDLKNIVIVASSGTVDVKSFPFKISNCISLQGITFTGGITANSTDNRTALEYYAGGTVSIMTILSNIVFYECLAVTGKSHTVPVIKLIRQTSTPQLELLNVRCGTVNNYTSDAPFLIHFQSAQYGALCLAASFPSRGYTDTVRITSDQYMSLFNISDQGFYKIKNEVTGNVAITEAQRLFDGTQTGSVPAAPANKNSTMFLNALGEWVDLSAFLAK